MKLDEHIQNAVDSLALCRFRSFKGRRDYALRKLFRRQEKTLHKSGDISELQKALFDRVAQLRKKAVQYSHCTSLLAEEVPDPFNEGDYNLRYSTMLTHLIEDSSEFFKRRKDFFNGNKNAFDDLIGSGNTDKAMEAFVRSFVEGKCFVEFGARGGKFLQFLAQHGAKVVGVTAGEGLPEAKKRIDGQLLINSNVLDLSLSQIQEIASQQPDVILVNNILDIRRWGNSPTGRKHRKLVNDFSDLLHQASGEKTRIYLTNLDYFPIIGSGDFRHDRKSQLSVDLSSATMSIERLKFGRRAIKDFACGAFCSANPSPRTWSPKTPELLSHLSRNHEIYLSDISYRFKFVN